MRDLSTTIIPLYIYIYLYTYIFIFIWHMFLLHASPEWWWWTDFFNLRVLVILRGTIHGFLRELSFIYVYIYIDHSRCFSALNVHIYPLHQVISPALQGFGWRLSTRIWRSLGPSPQGFRPSIYWIWIWVDSISAWYSSYPMSQDHESQCHLPYQSFNLFEIRLVPSISTIQSTNLAWRTLNITFR